MLVNVQPPRVPMKRVNPVNRRGGLALASLAVVVLTIIAGGGLRGFGPSQAPPPNAPVVGMAPAIERPVHGVQATGQTAGATDQSGSGGAGFASDDTHMFHGYACTIDCSGHKAGFNWARDQGIRDAARCPIAPANLMSLTEGCWAATGRNGPYAPGG